MAGDNKKNKIWQILRKVFKFGLYFFAAVGFFLTVGYIVVKFGLTNTSGIIDEQREGFFDKTNIDSKSLKWNKGDEWQVLKEALLRDKDVLSRVENETGVPARLVVAVVLVEQLRLFHSEREVFKQVFAPLKILGTQSQFSWGVSGIKPDTAKLTEKYLKDKNSMYYAGSKYENLLDFKTEEMDEERFARLTDFKDRYFSYLYTAVHIRELAVGWKNNGFDISNKPEILATLFNIGFENSVPKANPIMGGAEIDINGVVYSFGRLAGEFYYSDELEEFPRKKFDL